jgi:antitoxin VapB
MNTLINDSQVNKLAEELASYTGESIPEAIERALLERLEREKRKGLKPSSLAEQILEIGRRCASLPVRDDRSSDEILGYNEQGFFK